MYTLAVSSLETYCYFALSFHQRGNEYPSIGLLYAVDDGVLLHAAESIRDDDDDDGNRPPNFVNWNNIALSL